MACLPVQDGTLAPVKSRHLSPQDADDWMPYNDKVFSVLKKLHADGYKIVNFRCACCPSSPLQGSSQQSIFTFLEALHNRASCQTPS